MGLLHCGIYTIISNKYFNNVIVTVITGKSDLDNLMIPLFYYAILP